MKLKERDNYNEIMEGIKGIPAGQWQAPAPRIAVFIPLERTISHAAAVFPSFWALAMQQVPLISIGYTRTDVGRTRAAARFLNMPEFTHLLMLDLDHIHPVQTILKLASWVIRYEDVDIVGGLNFRRGAPFDPCAFIKGDDGRYYPPVAWEGGGLMEIDALGTGSMLISRRVLETVKPPWFIYDYDAVLSDIWTGEDIVFSRLAKEAGFNIYVDVDLTAPHLIDSVVDESSFRQHIADNNIQVQQLTNIKGGK